MIAATMLYAVAVALLCGSAGFALERVLGALRLPRRGVWIAALLASVALPCSAVFWVSYPEPVPVQHVGFDTTDFDWEASPVSKTVLAPSHPMRRNQRNWWPTVPALDTVLRGAWIASSSVMCVFLFGGALYFRPRARGWSPRREGGVPLWVADGAGPAVFGFMTPRIVIPRWLLDAPPEVRSLVIQHEREHVVGGDSLLLTVGLLVVALAPWNPALWWQLRRLRFALEVDCDARVLRSGVDAVAYGQTLLTVGQKQITRPMGALALVEPVSQLERRIRLMISNNGRHSLALTGVFITLAASFAVSAAALGPPDPQYVSELHKAPPGGDASQQLNLRFEALVKERFQQLLQQRGTGTPVVNVLFNDDGSVDMADYGIAPENPEVSINKTYFAQHFHLATDEVAFVGLQGVVSGTTGQRIIIAFTQRKQSNVPDVPSAPLLGVPDTRSIDRSLVERYFPDAFRGVMSDQARLWVLFDSDGNVLRTGTDSSGPAALTGVLEAEYPGIKTQFITATPVTDGHLQNVMTSSGESLELFSVWLQKGSARP